MRKKVSMIILIILILMTIPNIVKGANGLTLTPSNSAPTVGDSITLTIGSGVGGRVRVESSDQSIISVSTKSISIAYDSTTITAKAVGVGKATLTVYAEDLATKDDPPVDLTGKTKSVTINVKAKETSSSSSTTSSSSSSSTTENSNSNSGNSGKTTSSNSGSKTSASTKPNTNKEAVKNVVQTETEEEATPQFGMNSLMLNAINENGEKAEITFTPTFNIDTYEYTAEIESNIVDVEVLTEAGEYNDYVKVEKPESFNSGENIIKITMQKDDMSLTYTIKINKKESEETVQAVSDAVLETENKEQTLITFTIPQFIAVVLAICLIEGLLLKLPWKKLMMACKRRKGFGEDNDDELDNDEFENEDEQNNSQDGDEDKDD